jgi:hypothetical protein
MSAAGLTVRIAPVVLAALLGVAGVSAGGLGVGVGAILRAVHGVTRLLLGDPAGSSPGAFCSNLGRLAAGVGAMCATAPPVNGRRRT